MPKVEQEDSSPSVELSQQTLDKFAEIDAAVEKEEEVAQEPERPTGSPRAGDEGLNEDGTLKLDEDEPEPEPEKEPEPEPEPEEEPQVEEKPPTEIRSGEEVTLPNRLIQAGHRSGLSDEEIAALGPNAEKVLSKLADNADALSTKYGEIGRTLSQKPPESPKDNLLDLTPPPERSEFETEPEDKRFKTVQEYVNALQNKVKALEQRFEMNEAVRLRAMVDGFLDSRAGDYPELGKSSDITPAQFNARKDIVQHAHFIQSGALAEGVQMTEAEALEKAFSIYEGKNAKTTVRTKLVSEAKERAKQRTSRPTQRKTEQKFATQTEKAMENVRKFFSEKGMNIPEDEE